jgi:alkanesulfonate monooxygenase SsuD/methylene tetrahydromethanopterin reductase-like flavin-dependent oxidoreductase (luciferase family)
MKVGLALPHYSDYCTHESLLGHIERIEELGFDGVWVRDHLAYQPKRFDPPGTRFVDPFVTLSALASRTERIALGLAVMIPNRHPLTALQLLSSLDWLSGRRVELGMGVGGFGPQFEAVGISAATRVAYCEDTLALIRSAGQPAEEPFHGREVHLDRRDGLPETRADMTIWYGSLAPLAMRRAVRYCDGVMAARCTFTAFDDAVAEAAGSLGDPVRRLRKASEPLVFIAPGRAAAEEAFRARYPGGERPHLSELAGAVVAGGPEECALQLLDFRARGYDSVILDPRLCMQDFGAVVELLGREVLPALRD